LISVGKNHDFLKIKKSDFFLFKSDLIFFSKNNIFAIFSLYYAVKHQYIAKFAENLSSIVSCTLHKIEVVERLGCKISRRRVE